MKFSKFLLSTAFVTISLIGFSQRGKNLDYTVPATNTVVNTYTTLTNGTSGSSTLTVASNTLTGAGFSTPLAAGDLILIIQMQDAEMNIDWYDGTFGGQTRPYGTTPANFMQFGHQFGTVLNYRNAGKYEIKEVQSVSGGNTINIACGLTNTYAAAGHPQVVRIPRYNNLTLPSNTSIVPVAWNGSTGGIVAVEVLGNLTLNANSYIDASGYGFRGGVVAGTSVTGSGSTHSNGPGNGNAPLGWNQIIQGGEKGEGIGCTISEYETIYYSRYGRGAMANGGGGGGYQNSGGGGGANIAAAGTRTGKGIPTPGYAAYWNLELAGFASSTSPGGGRGGYSLAQSNPNQVTTGPNNNAWGGDFRKENGGYGGEGLAYDATRLFMGGGGGAGGQDSGQGGSGGRGGGICYVEVYGNVIGSGAIRSNGQAGFNSNPTGTSGGTRGNDGAGGAGAGGYIYVRNMNALPSTISLIANGGDGGDQDLRLPFSFSNNEIGGPGAGGAGGGIAFTSGSPVTSVVGGVSGFCLRTIGGGSTVNNPWIDNFPPNGATNGANGLSNLPTQIYNIIPMNDTICNGETPNVSVQVIGTQPGGSTVYWFTTPYGNSAVAAGTNPNPATYGALNVAVTTTFYVGICPGTFRVPVTIVVGQNPTITGTASIVDATCNTQGSISGLGASGGLAPYQFSWNGTTYPNGNLPSAPSGNYTLTVTDQNGCSSQSGPHTINGVGGPTISGTPSITNATCTANGSISGLTASGGAGTLTFEWNSVASPSENLSNAPAGNYTLVVTDGNGCTASSGPHTIGTTPGPTVAGTPTISDATCTTGGSITGLSGTGGVGPYTYEWNGNAGSANLSGAAAGNYTLVITDNNGCTVSSGPHTIGTTPGPTVTGTANITDATCTADGSISGLSGTGGVGPYTYEWNGVVGSATVSGPAGNYTLIITDNNGCTVSSGPHTIGTTPGPSIGGTANITDATCTTGGSITGLTINGGVGPFGYAWNATVTPTQNLSNATAGSYTLTVLDANGCTATSGPYTINLVGGPVVDESAMVITNESCGNGNGSIVGLSVSGGTPGYTYEWNGVASAGINLSNAIAGNYTLEVTDAAGCTTTSGPHTITNIPAPTIDESAVVISDESCNGSFGSITGLSVSGSNLVYSWTNNGGNQVNATNLSQGSYTLTVTDQVTGCTAQSGPHVVGFQNGPTVSSVNAVVTDASCNGTLGSIIGISASGTGGLTYSWSNSSVNSLNATGLSAGTYTLTVTDDASGCTAQAGPFTVNYIAGPTANFTYSPMDPNTDELVTFTDASTGTIVGWNWNIDTMSSSNQDETYTFVNEGVYTVTLTVVDQNGCSDDMTVVLEILGELVIPNVITPNADGTNDYFVLAGLKPNTSVTILNRWGNEIFSSSSYMNEWNGQDKSGNFVNEGVYTYIINLPDGSQKQGFVHVVRNN